ncbi:MAG TPA: hypothetical protein VGG10_21850 [Rhizomicrobium sp.]|jgi:hypothetical protein
MKAYDDILKEAQENPAILGLLLSGSRGKGFENAHSDYDLILIAADDAVGGLREKYAGAKDIDLTVCSLAQFRDYAGWGSAEAWIATPSPTSKFSSTRRGCWPIWQQKRAASRRTS